jgi:hypothetical protein
MNTYVHPTSMTTSKKLCLLILRFTKSDQVYLAIDGDVAYH